MRPLRLRPSLSSANSPTCPKRACSRVRFSSRVVKEHDVILLRHSVRRKQAKLTVSSPIRAGENQKLGYGATINGSELIGRPLPGEATDSQGQRVRLYELTLPQYITNTARVATPIYPQDGSMIVSILDLSLPVPGEDPDADAGPPVEIFEAGTGMGSLSLQIARAIHGANPPVPPALRDALLAAPYQRGRLLRQNATDDSSSHDDPHAPDFSSPIEDVATVPAEKVAELDALLRDYRASRRAVLHTLDVNPSHSRKAHGVVRGFRRGRYLLDMDFHVSTIRSHLEPRLAASIPGGARKEPFLSHAILDLPASANHADLVVEALRPGGKLVVFFPSVTQALEFVVWAEETGQRVRLDRVLELPTSTRASDFSDGIGGREWDVRVVTPRTASKKGGGRDGAAAAEEMEGPERTGSVLQDVVDASEGEGEGPKALLRKVNVCRPKVGTTVTGGGFLAVFTKRMPATRAEEAFAAKPDNKQGDESSETRSGSPTSESPVRAEEQTREKVEARGWLSKLFG